ncbi:hypothetical protein [Mucilaginibacter flavidus]|uniref:hypothetical protein n=1 Tax=Mucilaginibacter flavidus TaxID=2949309 RepID=UPI002091FE1C|nr:hypothetical protein [Mucilaginibacter flavidus]MCO5948794.1 hypothetical protein [Mucilaginibacter flavidus]
MEKKLFKSLKNGKVITLFYKRAENSSYTVHLQYKNELFIIHYYVFDGNDVFDEENYNNKLRIETKNFNEFLELVKVRFPGMIENWSN